jgi:hypothetical protein
MTSSSPRSRPSPAGGLRPALAAAAGEAQTQRVGPGPATKIHQFQVFRVSGDCRPHSSSVFVLISAAVYQNERSRVHSTAAGVPGDGLRSRCSYRLRDQRNDLSYRDSRATADQNPSRVYPARISSEIICWRTRLHWRPRHQREPAQSGHELTDDSKAGGLLSRSLCLARPIDSIENPLTK